MVKFDTELGKYKKQEDEEHKSSPYMEFKRHKVKQN